MAGSLEADLGAVDELGFDADFVGAGDEAVNKGNGETTFVVFFDFAVGFYDLWVNQGGERGVFLVVEVVADDDNSLVDAELGGGHGGGEFVRVIFFPVEGTLYHVGDNLAGFVGNFGDLFRDGAEARVGGSNDIHDIIIPCIMR